MDMRGLQALWGPLAPFPAVFSWIDRWNRPSAETRVQLQSPPAHFLPPGVPFLDKGYISSLSHLSALCRPTLNRLRTVSHPVIPPQPPPWPRTRKRSWEISFVQIPRNRAAIWCGKSALLHQESLYLCSNLRIFGRGYFLFVGIRVAWISNLFKNVASGKISPCSMAKQTTQTRIINIHSQDIF